MEKLRRRGELSDTKKGSKPSIAFETQKNAHSNIIGKFNYLGALIRESEKGDLPSDVPGSIRQFNGWSPVVDGIQLKPNSQITLKRYPELLDSLTALIRTVKQCRSGPKKDSRGERLASARRNANFHKTIREIAERALISARAEATAIAKELMIVKSQLMSERKAAAEMIDALQGQVEDLKVANASLSKQITKVVGLRAK